MLEPDEPWEPCWEELLFKPLGVPLGLEVLLSLLELDELLPGELLDGWFV